MKIKGGPELHAFLQQLPVRMERNVMRGALRAGARVIQQQAKANVPAKSGKLRRAIKVDTVTGDGLVKARVKLRGPHSFVGVFIEYGVRAHVIAPGDAKVGARSLNKKQRASQTDIKRANGLLKIGDHWIRGAVLHPGIAATPFLRPAMDTRAGDAVNAVGEYIAQRLTLGNITVPTIEVEED